MSDTESNPNIRTAVRYHQAVSRFAGPEELASFFHPEAVHTQLPNALFPNGTLRRLPELLAASQRAPKLLSHQDFEVINVVASGSQVAIEATWSGTLAVALGELPAGHVMGAHIATFIEFREGKIVAQRNYDCYEPLRSGIASDQPAEGKYA
ncbi:nuclear transport factor 2 family protein [Streptomyces sp. NPDC006314]|uniref:nuclear transport factor 2 family protein n=1 Tax=Streptomyces sp. NPDC006314 TaxID=3154475 RepID=UPI0033BBC9C6